MKKALPEIWESMFEHKQHFLRASSGLQCVFCDSVEKVQDDIIERTEDFA